MNRLLPVNCRMKACGDGWPRSEMAARYTPAGQPSVRSMSWLRSGSPSSIPATAVSSSAVSPGVKRSSRARTSVISPAARRRASGSGGSARVMSTI